MNFITALRYIKTVIVELNLFESAATRTNPHHSRSAIISTRFYVVLLTIAVFILILFTALDEKTQTVTIRNPSQDVFQQLYSKYSTTLHCPCSQVEIPYKTFISTSYKFHPVCSSVFISNSWINHLFLPQIGYYFPLDFRSSASGQFQLLASLCLFINRTLQDEIDDYLSSALLSPQILSLVSLKEQSEARTQFLNTSTINTFRRLLSLVRGTTQMNGLQPAMQTSKMHIIHIYPHGSIDVAPLETIWIDENGEECFCGVTSNCEQQSGFFDLFAPQTDGVFELTVAPMVTVPGFVVGCYALDALLHSSLQCLFDSVCLTNILTFFPMNNLTNLDPFNINQTQYSPETTIEMLVNNLFIEHWSSEISFSAYYSKCAPILCTYKLTVHNGILQILTTLLGVYGGLTVVLRICVPRVVRWWRNRKITTRTDPNTRSSLLQRLRSAQQWIKVRMIDLNLFETNVTRTDPYELQTARIATRVYLVAMLVVFSIISVYLFLSVRVQTDKIQNPSQTTFENLLDKYASTLQCPCSRIANAYGLFTSLSPTFHPVCSSLFVSDAWIISISSLNDINSVYAARDFRVAGAAFFNTLATLCSLSNATVNNAWDTLGQTPLITDSALVESEFQARTKVAIEQFQRNTISEFEHILSLVDLHTKTMYATGYMNIIVFTARSSTFGTSIDFGWIPMERTTCSCGFSDQCDVGMYFLSYSDGTIYGPNYLVFTLPDLLFGCFVLPSVLRSSLRCFFNQTCLDAVQREVASKRSIDISILDTNSTRFSPQDSIGTILNNLMVETWNEKVEYDKYYEQCAPEQCTYTYISYNNPVQTVTTLVGLFGGLLVVLKILVPLLVRWIRNRIRPHEERNITTDKPSIAHRLRSLCRALKTKLLQLNLFHSELSLDDDQCRHREVITTRIYLILLSLAVLILVIYTCIDTQTQIVKVLNPSQQQFDQLRLHPQYSATLDCSCQNIIVPYQSFIYIKPHYHQLCSSDFVATNSTWISLLYSSTVGVEYSYDDYHLFAVPQFQLLSSLCALANETLTEAIAQFSTNLMTNERVQSRESVEFQASYILSQFTLSTPRSFVRTLDFIRYMAQGNGIVSSILSNWRLVSPASRFEGSVAWTEPHSYANDTCSCGTSATCTSEASFDGLNVPGFRVGCYPLEALLQSTLECLYNISCIEQLKSMYNPSNITFNTLNSSLSSPNSTVQSLVDVLLVERWETSVVYEQYYSTCAPRSCTYTFVGQISLIYTITTIIGLYGGLTVALKLISLILVRIGYYLIIHRRRRIGQG